jgi:hypothetical protein
MIGSRFVTIAEGKPAPEIVAHQENVRVLLMTTFKKTLPG